MRQDALRPIVSGVSASQRGDARQFPVPLTRPEAALCPQQGHHSHRSSRSLWARIGEADAQKLGALEMELFAHFLANAAVGGGICHNFRGIKV